LTDEELGLRGSPLYEAAELVAELVAQQARTICFIKSRKAVELIVRHASALLEPALAARVAPYRAGYTPAQRQDIQRRLTEGELLAVVATDALELGIDIGTLDAAICVTFPGTVASLKQMWGRAGRRGRGLAVYIAGEDALDQFFCRHPDQFLERAVEAAIIDPESPEIHAWHLLCAAHEFPLGPGDDSILGGAWRAHAEELAGSGYLRERATGFVPARADDYPAARVALRSASAETFALIESSSGEVLGTIEATRALATVHEGAIYLHLGRSYQVLALDLHSHRALLEPFDGDYYTQAKREAATYIERLLDRRETLGVTLSYGTVVVEETVLGYQRKRLVDQEVIDFTTLSLPTVALQTRALWYELDGLTESVGAGRNRRHSEQALPLGRLLGALHALSTPRSRSCP
jgi:DEAD/DEAH box helicase domain-containing protein